MTNPTTDKPPIITILEGAKEHIERAIHGWMDGGRSLQDLAVIIQWVPDGKGRVAPVDRDRFADMIEPSADVRASHPNDANVIVACQIASQLRHRMAGFTPVVLNFDPEDGAVSRVILLRFVGGEMDVKSGTAGVA
jgi:hypothetical protein